MCYCKFIFITSLNGVGDAVQGDALAGIVQCLLLAFVTWFFLLFSLSKQKKIPGCVMFFLVHELL